MFRIYTDILYEQQSLARYIYVYYEYVHILYIRDNIIYILYRTYIKYLRPRLVKHVPAYIIRYTCRYVYICNCVMEGAKKKIVAEYTGNCQLRSTASPSCNTDVLRVCVRINTRSARVCVCVRRRLYYGRYL